MKPSAHDTSSAVGGFSLIELLIVVALLGIITTLAVSSLRSFVNSQKVRNASYDFSSALMLARNEATKRNGGVKIKALTSSWSGGWQIVDSSNTALQNQNAYTNITFTTNVTTSTGCTTPCIVFNRTGRIDRSSSTTVTSDSQLPSFKLTDTSGSSSTKRCLLIDSSGKINTTTTSC